MWLFNLERILTTPILNNLYEIGIIARNSPKTDTNVTTETVQIRHKISEWVKEFDNRWDRISMFLSVPSIFNLIDCAIFVTMGFSHLSPFPMLNTLVTILSEISSHWGIVYWWRTAGLWWDGQIQRELSFYCLLYHFQNTIQLRRLSTLKVVGGIETSRLFCCLNIYQMT